MRQRSMQTSQGVDVPLAEAERPPRVGARRRASLVLLPALLALGFTAAACSSNGPSSGPSSSAASDISQGLSAQSAGQTQQAINDFKAAVAASPTSPIAYYDLGVVYQQDVKNLAQAATEYNKALLADSTYKPAMYNLAIVQTTTDPQGAVSTYNQLLKLNANDPNVLFNLGLLLISQGQTNQGDADVQKAVLIKPALKSRVPAGVPS